MPYVLERHEKVQVEAPSGQRDNFLFELPLAFYTA